MAFHSMVPGLGVMQPLRTPLLAGLAASVAMSALGPIAPDGVLGFLVTGSLGVVVHLVSPAARGSIGRTNPTGIPAGILAAPTAAALAPQGLSLNRR